MYSSIMLITLALLLIGSRRGGLSGRPNGRWHSPP